MLFAFIAFFGLTLLHHFTNIKKTEVTVRFSTSFKAGIEISSPELDESYVLKNIPRASACNPTTTPAKERVTKAMRATAASSLLAEAPAAPLGLSSGLSVACVTPHHCAQDLKNLGYVNCLTGHLPELLKSR